MTDPKRSSPKGRASAARAGSKAKPAPKPSAKATPARRGARAASEPEEPEPKKPARRTAAADEAPKVPVRRRAAARSSDEEPEALAKPRRATGKAKPAPEPEAEPEAPAARPRRAKSERPAPEEPELAGAAVAPSADSAAEPAARRRSRTAAPTEAQAPEPVQPVSAGARPEPVPAEPGPRAASARAAEPSGASPEPAPSSGWRAARAPRPTEPRPSSASATPLARRAADNGTDSPVQVDLPFDSDDEDFGREAARTAGPGPAARERGPAPYPSDDRRPAGPPAADAADAERPQAGGWRANRGEDRPKRRWREQFAPQPPAAPSAPARPPTPPPEPAAPRPAWRQGESEPPAPEAAAALEPSAPQAELDRRAKARLAAASLGAGRPMKGAWKPKHAAGQARPAEALPPGAKPRGAQECEGLLVIDQGGHGKLRSRHNQFLPSPQDDVHVTPKLIQRCHLRQGAIVRGRPVKGMGKHKWDLAEVLDVDGLSVEEANKLPDFRRLTSIDPDFHYALGDQTGDVSLRVVDLICPIGRGSRGLIVAPPRTGKTILMQKIAKGIEQHYPEVALMVLLVDERPEEATEWKRSTKGDVFVSTNDELPRVHVELAESVWARCTRLVELGKDVVLLLDSITRLARAYNHVAGNSGKTMSGGLDSRAMERPKQFFGSARNTEAAGSLTILGTTLIETGSLMDKLIFEEFKGTGNMELVLSRKLSDRRIFPAIDVERSGTRKEEKLMSAQRLKRVTTLRRVLARMHFAEAMELLITRLEDVEKNDDFLKRFDVDPEA